MKKADLIQGFLDRQAENNQLVMQLEAINKLQNGFNLKSTNQYKALFKLLGISNDGLKGKKAYVDKYEEYKMSLTDYSKLKEENEKLKEENEKLKAGTLLKFQEVEIEDLTQEIQILKEILDEVRVYLGGFDGDEVEVFDKIVKGE